MTTSRGPLPADATFGLLHPGAMGTAVGRQLVAGGHEVLWCSRGRSAATLARAENAGFLDVASVSELSRSSDVILSIVPPHAALDVARSVAQTGFGGVYVDANAISPARAKEIEAVVRNAGGRFVDGGIVGRPPERPGTTWLHLSGPEAADVAARMPSTPMAIHVVSDEVGAASALKVAFAAWTKGSTALRATVLAYAEAAGVGESIETQWEQLQPGFWAEGRSRAVSVTAKAWRFEGEMHEIADAFEAERLPGGFHRAAAEAYRRLAPLRDEDAADEDAAVAAVVAALTNEREDA